jgi:hypothetical protein
MERRMSSGPETRKRAVLRPELLLGLAAVAGAAAFGAALGLGSAARAWQAFHVNFLFWTGLAFAGVVLSAVLRLTDSRWGFAVRRLGECSAAFLPVSLVLYLGVVAGHGTLMPDVHHLAPAKQLWLAPTFLLVRDGAALLGLAALAFVYLYYSLRPDVGAARDAGERTLGAFGGWLTRGWRGAEAEAKRSRKATAFLAVALVVAYALVFTLLAIDQVMALDPTWMSTLFGAYFFITNLYGGWALLAFAAVLARRANLGGLGAAVGDDVLHSLGKLLFAFCFLSLDFFWSQFLVIWYGNLPEETPFVLRRIRQMPWQTVALAVLVFCFVVPFLALLFRSIKRDPRTLAAVGLVVLAALWVERFLLVAPSTWRGSGLPLGPLELGVTLGFLGLAGLAWLFAARRVPLLPAAAVTAALEAESAVAEETHG